MEVSEKSIKGWYELKGQDVYIWEGVLSMYTNNSTSFKLFKVMDGDIFEIHVDLAAIQNSINFKSEGYWQCAEIRGTLSTGHLFLCHSTDIEHAVKILKVLPSAIIQISIRLDPDPFRNWNSSKIEERLQEWKKVTMQFCEFPEDSKIILDSNMLN